MIIGYQPGKLRPLSGGPVAPLLDSRIGLLFGLYLRATLFLLWLQMLGTITPLFFFPHEVFAVFPFAPTLEGQYIVKNIVLISAGLVIGATVRGGRVVADPNKIKGPSKENKV